MAFEGQSDFRIKLVTGINISPPDACRLGLKPYDFAQKLAYRTGGQSMCSLRLGSRVAGIVLTT